VLELRQEGAPPWDIRGALTSAPVTPRISPLGRTDLPIYAAAQGGPGELILTYDPIDYVARPEPLANVRDGYAMYIVGDSMVPAFRQGELALIHPHMPFRPGDDVLVFRELEHEVAAMVKTLVKASEDTWTLEQFNPPKKFTLSRKEWPRCHRIIGKYSRG
jgi:phage repressor protein C with HTH and peptisase S24 domain